MVVLVVVINVLISLLCLYVAWYVWNLRRALAIATAVVTIFERDTHNALQGAPQAISQGQLGVRGSRESYQQLEIQLQRVQQVLAFLGLVQTLLPIVTRSSTRFRQRSRAEVLKSKPSRRSRRQQRSKR
ncbi:hypothetical protein [Allocoleopsis sp.]|uniref:hypothetical protein n=1 Tax=Allocoleopsis sp. TaxID=3088169 RepID=UPI002FD734A3